VIGAGGVEDADGAAVPHAALKQVTSRQVTAAADFPPTLRGCRGPTFDGRAATSIASIPLKFKDRNDALDAVMRDVCLRALG
jgi:hypothetical protein